MFGWRSQASTATSQIRWNHLGFPGVQDSAATGLPAASLPTTSSVRQSDIAISSLLPCGAVESLKEVIVSLVVQLLPVKVSLRDVRQPSNLGIGSIGNVATEIIVLEDEIHSVLGGKFSNGNHHNVFE